MTTDQLGPAVEGEDDAARPRARDRRVRRSEIEVSFLRNLYYFWVGRFGGALAYFLPAWWRSPSSSRAVRGPSRAGSRLPPSPSPGFLHPDHPRQLVRRRGHGGEPLLPEPAPAVRPDAARAARGRGPWAASFPAARAGAAVLHPLHHSLRPGDHATRGVSSASAARADHAERPVRVHDAWRKKVPYGDTEGDAHKHWPADPRRTSCTSWTTGRRPGDARRRRGLLAGWRGADGGGAARARAGAADACPSHGWADRRWRHRADLRGGDRGRSWQVDETRELVFEPGRDFRTTTRS